MHLGEGVVPTAASPLAGGDGLSVESVPTTSAKTEARAASLLPYYGYRAAELLVGALPRPVAYGLAVIVADLMLWFAPRTFDALKENLRHVLPDADERTLRGVTRRNVHNVTRSWVDVMTMPWRPKAIGRRLKTRGEERFHEAQANGRGIAVISAHFGTWEAGLAGWNVSGGSMALLAEELRPRQLFDRVARARATLGVRVIPLDVEGMRSGDAQSARRAGALAMRDVFRLLKSGGVIAMAIDRDLIGNGTPLPFFGVPAPIPIGVVEVAIRCNAAILPVALVRAPRGGVDARVFPEIPYDSSAPLESEVLRVTDEVLRIWEELIREHPDQWHVLEPIWPAS